MHELPLPQTVGGSQIGDPKRPGSRVTGAPSQKYPILRDLAAAPARVTLEVDTETQRYVGVIKSIAKGLGDRPILLMYMTQGSPLSDDVFMSARAEPVRLEKILAFRVLKIEVEALPADLS